VSPADPGITLVVDGVEVTAREGEMLVDAAKGGDVEIPVFCYEPKLGQPVGACRMCLVEVEGIPKLQTACSTPVRDGMVVYTQTDRVIEAQNAVVEFLLVNHPLDCPVCDKGGECPLQDIAMGWGPGRSRVTDPKRHFQKPLPLSPLVRIDRERCILCYRCVRFSQEVAEDDQLQLIGRGAQTYVGTFDDRPYIAPFHGNIIELCPVGALTSEAYRFRARPWDIEDAGSICTLCPAQCNVRFTVRDDQIKRVMARDNSDVDDGWLCDKGRFGFQLVASSDRPARPQLRAGGALGDATWAEAMDRAAAGLAGCRGSVAAIVGGSATNEEGYLVQRIVRGALSSTAVDSGTGAARDRDLLLELSRPELAAKVGDLDAADSILVIGCDPLHDMPILDLRIRKAVRRDGAKLVVASARPNALDGGAEEVVRFAPGSADALLAALAGELGAEGHAPASGEPGAEGHAPSSGDLAEAGKRMADAIRGGSCVIVYGERAGALRSLPDVGRAIGAKLLEVPADANGRGLREVGCLPGIGPGLAEAPGEMAADEIKGALEAGELTGVILWESDPLRELPDRGGWNRALGAADFVLAVSVFGNASGGHADVYLPAEAFAEKEGTVTHPDGRLQRLRPSVPAPGAVRPGWEVLTELAARLGDETGIDSAPEALAAVTAEVPFYAGITHEEIGGRGIRWQEREAAVALSGEAAGIAPASPSSGRTVAPSEGGSTLVEGSAGATPAASDGNGIALGTYRDLWAGEPAERSPALRFLVPSQTLELAPADAGRLGVSEGDEVDVRSNGTSVRARVKVHERMRDGAGFLIDGLAENGANVLGGAEVVDVSKVEETAR
jgi:NADH-quinone oxidoreductase subunit G